MTTIDSLKALTDEDLIHKLTVQIMGWQIGWNWDKSGHRIASWFNGKQQWQELKSIWDPLTRFSDTLKLIDAIQGQDYRLDLSFTETGDLQARCRKLGVNYQRKGIPCASYFSNPSERKHGAPSPQRAVCFAILMAVEASSIRTKEHSI